MKDETCDYLSIDTQKVDRIKKYLSGDLNPEKIAEIFKALSDPTRLKIMRALELDDLCVCDIASLLSLTQPSVSHHLKSLRQLGIVKFRKEKKMAIYSLNGGRLAALLAVVRDLARNTI